MYYGGQIEKQIFSFLCMPPYRVEQIYRRVPEFTFNRVCETSTKVYSFLKIFEKSRIDIENDGEEGNTNFTYVGKI